MLDQEFALQVYEKHTAEVLEYASSQGRPVYIHTVTDGWEKLCEFLGIAVPDQPYPRSNSRTTRSRTVTHIDMLTVGFRCITSFFSPFTLLNHLQNDERLSTLRSVGVDPANVQHTFIVVPSMVLVLVAATGYASRWTTRVHVFFIYASLLLKLLKTNIALCLPCHFGVVHVGWAFGDCC